MDHDTAPSRTRPLLLLAGLAAGLVAAVALGIWAGWAYDGTRPDTGGGDGDDLDHAIEAVLVGSVAGLVVYVVAVGVAVRCTVIRGRRAAGALAILAATVVVPALVRSSGSLAGATDLSALWTPAGLVPLVAALVTAGALVGAVVEALPTGTAGQIAAGALATLLVVPVVGDL